MGVFLTLAILAIAALLLALKSSDRAEARLECRVRDIKNRSTALILDNEKLERHLRLKLSVANKRIEELEGN